MTTHNHTHNDNHRRDKVEISTDKSTILPAAAKTLKLTLTAMDCPTEAAMIKQAFANHPHIHALEFDLINRTVTITHTLTDQQDIHRTLIGIGLLEEDSANLIRHASRKAWWLFAASGVFAVSSELLDWANANAILIASTALLAIILAGASTLKKGWQALRRLTLNINLLMSIAVIGAMLIGQFPEAAVVIFLFAFAEKIEAFSLDRARHAISALQVHAPDSAYVLQADGTWVNIPSRQIQIGQTLRAKPGDQIAADGVVVGGHSSVNQAMITGESAPIHKSIGDTVYAGTLNQEGVLEYQATSIAGSATLDRIAQAIQHAQQQRAPTERMVDAFAKIYTPCVFVFAVCMALIPPLFLSAAWLTSLYQALVLLVIACPCALVISTPITVVSALTHAARCGILIKGGQYLEQARHLKTIAFDKTGTLTEGKFSLQGVINLSDMHAAACLQIAASLNSLSQHPIAAALVAAAELKPHHQVTQFQSLTGRGVRGTIEQNEYVLGNLRLMAESNVALPQQLRAQIEQLEASGITVAILAQPTRQALAMFTIADRVRHNSQATIAQLHALGVHTVMLTGDNLATAQATSHQVGIKETHAQLLPEDKLNLIVALQTRRGMVAMLGDGVNDAPAMARADIGITLGAAASATALETADIALMQDDLSKVPELIRLSQRCARILMQNISIAVGIKACFLILTMLGHANLWMAVFADMGASLLVILNGLRLLKSKKRDAPQS